MKIPLDLDPVENLVEWIEEKRVLQGKDPDTFRRLINKWKEIKPGIGQIKDWFNGILNNLLGNNQIWVLGKVEYLQIIQNVSCSFISLTLNRTRNRRTNKLPLCSPLWKAIVAARNTVLRIQKLHLLAQKECYDWAEMYDMDKWNNTAELYFGSLKHLLTNYCFVDNIGLKTPNNTTTFKVNKIINLTLQDW